MRLTLARLVLPPGPERVEPLEGLGWTPMAGDIARTGTVGGGPGSTPGDRRCIERCDADGCIIVDFRPAGNIESLD